MKKTAWPIHPPLFAIFPILSLYSSNLSFVPLHDLWRPLLLAAAGALALYGLLALLFRSAARGAVGASVLIGCFFAYQWFSNLFWGSDDFNSLWLWSVCSLTLVGLFAWKWKWTTPLNVLSAFLVAATTVQIGLGFANAGSVRMADATSGKTTASGGTRPDIYYIILDGYGRSDALQKYLHYSNADFIDGLRKRGFYVADESHSNFCQTELSIPSSLNLNFIQTLVPKPPSNPIDRHPLGVLTDDSLARRYLKDRGYVNVGVTSGFTSINFSKADLRLTWGGDYTLMETALIQMTPMSINPYIVPGMFIRRRENLQFALHNLETLAGASAKPRFITAHILAPHPPFVFNADGSFRQRKKGPFGFYDGSDFMDHEGSPQDYLEGYVGQVQYLNKRVLEVVDALLNAPGPKPVIMIQGDHGSKLHLDQNSLAKTDIDECFSNLSTYYVPPAVEANLYPSITPVNSFRVLFNGLFGDHFPLLPDRSWYSEEESPYVFEEVTGRLAKGKLGAPSH